jgi:hypothetical protein
MTGNGVDVPGVLKVVPYKQAKEVLSLMGKTATGTNFLRVEK